MTPTKKILGLWNLSRYPLNLGRLILFLEELTILKQQKKISGFKICYLGSRKEVSPDLITLSNNIAGVDGVFFKSTLKKGELERLNEKYLIWPEKNYEAESTLKIQEFYRQNKKIPFLDFKPRIYKKVKNFLGQKGVQHPFVSLHLKNTGDRKGESNASGGEWYDFLKFCRDHYNLKFVIVGKDKAGNKLKNLENVITTNEYHLGLTEDLAIIRLSSFFMGMASGPCNIAIMSRIPYVIFKDPDHHYDKMHTELGGKDHFPFATGYQKILREVHTGEKLKHHFEKLFNSIAGL